MDHRMPRILGAGLLAVALTAPPTDALAQSSSGQAVLQVIKRIETLEQRLARIEEQIGKAPSAAPAEASAELRGSLEALKEQVATIESSVSDTHASAEKVGELDGRVAALAAELGAVRDDVAKTDDTEGERLETLKAELAGLIGELRALAEKAEAAEAAETEGPKLEFTGRMHAQYATTSHGERMGSEFFIRRARVTAEIELNELVSGKVQPDFGEGKIALKDAYFRLSFSPQLRMTVGQFKRPFDLFELTSSTQILVVERAGVVGGAGSCAGVGGICSFSRFTEKLGYSDRDIGVQFDGKLGASKWSYAASVTNGTGANTAEENEAKSYGARFVYSGFANMKLGINGAWHDYANGIDSTRTHAPAYGADVEMGNFNRGWHAQIGVVRGDNWKNLDASGVPSAFRTAQAIVTYRRPLGGAHGISAIEPLVRLSWADPDDALDENEELFSTLGVVFHFVGRNKIGINAERWHPAAGDGEWSFKVQSYLHW